MIESTHIGTLADEHIKQRNEQDEIAHVGDGYSVGIIIYPQVSALHVFIIASLGESVALILSDIVHGDIHGFVVGCDFRNIIHRCIGARIVDDLEVFQLQGEVKLFGGLVFQHQFLAWYSLTQIDIAAFRGKPGGECTQQDDKECHVDHPYRDAAEQAMLQHIDEADHRQNSPCYDKPQRTVDMGLGKCGSLGILNKGSCHHYNDDDGG